VEESIKEKQTNIFSFIDAHGLKIQGGGVLEVFSKILRGVEAFRKNCQGGHPILDFIAFLLTSFSKICLGGGEVFHPLPPTPVCASMFSFYFGPSNKS
jgi:hypothetical protein